MKFGKSLSNQIEKTLPEWRDKFLSYKELKKKLKQLEPAKGGGGDDGGQNRPAKRPRVDVADCKGGGDREGMSKEESDFRNLLEGELEKFNNFFVEKEEEYIIKLKVPIVLPCFPFGFVVQTKVIMICLVAEKIILLQGFSHSRLNHYFECAFWKFCFN